MEDQANRLAQLEDQVARLIPGGLLIAPAATLQQIGTGVSLLGAT